MKINSLKLFKKRLLGANLKNHCIAIFFRIATSEQLLPTA